MKNRKRETGQPKETAASKRGRSRIRIVALAAVCIVTALALIYIGFAVYFQSHFHFGTTIDGIRAGGRSAEKVEELIKAEVENYSVELMLREDQSETISGDSIGIVPVFNGEVQELLRQQNGFAWVVALFQKQELELEKAVSFDESALDQTISRLDCMKPENQREPVNAAYSGYTREGYSLIPADYGTAIDKNALKKAVGEAVMSLEDSVDMEKTGCYKEPEVTDDDSRLLSLIDTLNRYTGMTITYEFGDKKEILDGEMISEWLSEENMQVKVDEEAVLAFVKSLAKTYNTAYKPKTLATSYGKTVTISGGFYGWRIDNAGEVEQILADLKEGKDVTREPVYLTTANSHGENDYGDSYVEINLTAQHLFLYVNGRLVVESDFVSGNVAKGHSSPTGAFGLTYKTTDAVLRGEDYATPVKYWMPFAGDVGMHDATWRKTFGGNIYKSGGSHGCINLPFSAAETIYKAIDQGYAVLVYTLPGTESKAQQQQDVNGVINAINGIGTVTLESEGAVTNARNLYNALSDSARASVTNYGVLTAAEAALAQLKAGAVPPPGQGGQPTDQGNQPTDQEGQPEGNSPADQGGQPTDQEGQPEGNPPADQGGQPTDQGNQPTDQEGQPTDQGNAPSDQEDQPADQGNAPLN